MVNIIIHLLPGIYAIFKNNKSVALNLVLAVISFMSLIASTFISPKEKYEADDISSEITRDPLTLAEALNVISRDLKERKAGEMILPSIFIASPLPTHPPVDRRIDILLKAANKDRTALEGI